MPRDTKHQQINLYDQSQNAMHDTSDVAAILNRFFTEIGPNLAKEFNEPWTPNFPESIYSMDSFMTNICEVKELCIDINIDKASAVEGLTSRVLKHAFLALTDKLTFCFNLSLNQGIFPDTWKGALIVPLFKGGDRTNVSNYRPVSLLPLPGKLLESIEENYAPPANGLYKWS